MKSYIANSIFAVSIVIIAGFTTTYAQMSSDTILRVKIPNAFVVRDKTYPAGEYIIKPIEEVGNLENMLELTGPGVSTIIFDTNNATVNNPPKNTELVFDKVGDDYFLSKIFVEGETNGNELQRSKTEKKMIAAGEPTEEYIVIEIPANSKKDSAR